MNTHLVRDWMTPDPVTVSAGRFLPEAYLRMKSHNIRRLPVMEDGELVGVVTLSDIRAAAPLGSLTFGMGNSMFNHTRVRQVMTAPIVTIGPDAPMTEAATRMMEGKFGGLPVLDGDRLVGILTESDVFRMMLEMSGERRLEPVS